MNNKYWTKSFRVLVMVALSALVASPLLLPGLALAAPVDSAPPTVALNSPASGAIVLGQVTVEATAADTFSACVVTVFGQKYDVSELRFTHPGGNIFACGTDMTATYQSIHGTNVSRLTPFLLPADYSGVTRVEFYVDGVLKFTDTAAPYTFNWDTTAGTNGSHVLLAKAFDQAGNVGSSATVNVAVDNPIVVPAPDVSIVSPLANATVSGSVTVMTSITIVADLVKGELYVDGALKATNTNTASPISFLWDTKSVANGSHTLQVKAYDVAGNVGSSPVITVTVNNAVFVPVLTSITLSPASASLAIGQTRQFSAVALDQNGAPLALQPTIAWSSSDSSKATVSSAGLVTALSAGTVTITASSGSVTKTASVTVNPVVQLPVLTSIIVSPATASITAGTVKQFSASSRDQNGAPIAAAIIWSSSNPLVATVDGNGLVTALAAGSATITAKSGNISGSAGLTVTAPVVRDDDDEDDEDEEEFDDRRGRRDHDRDEDNRGRGNERDRRGSDRGRGNSGRN